MVFVFLQSCLANIDLTSVILKAPSFASISGPSSDIINSAPPLQVDSVCLCMTVALLMLLPQHYSDPLQNSTPLFVDPVALFLPPAIEAEPVAWLKGGGIIWGNKGNKEKWVIKANKKREAAICSAQNSQEGKMWKMVLEPWALDLKP